MGRIRKAKKKRKLRCGWVIRVGLKLGWAGKLMPALLASSSQDEGKKTRSKDVRRLL